MTTKKPKVPTFNMHTREERALWSSVYIAAMGAGQILTDDGKHELTHEQVADEAVLSFRRRFPLGAGE